MPKRKRKPKQRRNAFGQFTKEPETLEFPVGTFAKPKPTLWQRIRARLLRRMFWKNG